MKILHLAKMYYPNRGGIESVTKSIAEGGVKHGIDVTVLCTSPNCKSKNEKINGVKVVRCKNLFSLANQPFSFRYIYNAIVLMRQNDLIHIHGPNPLAMLLAILFGRNKLILHWHSDILGKGLFRFLVMPIEMLCIKFAQKVIVTSHQYMNASKLLKGWDHKCEMIPLGISLQGKNFIKHSPQDKYILSVGRLVSYKGFDCLIRSMVTLERSINLVIVGTGVQAEELKALANKLGVADRIYFAGQVSDDELSRLYQNAWVFCLPSVTRAEAFGVVLLEALAYSLPLVTTNMPGSGMNYVNKHGVTGLQTDNSNHQSLTRAFSQLLDEPKLYQKLNLAAWERVNTLFDDEQCVGRYYKLYENVVNAKIKLDLS